MYGVLNFSIILNFHFSSSCFIDFRFQSRARFAAKTPSFLPPDDPNYYNEGIDDLGYTEIPIPIELERLIVLQKQNQSLGKSRQSDFSEHTHMIAAN